jgi:crotonobetainyl-CoA:carnitine CoA-transferase CaiB-like acyl-CoA transferase
MSGALALEGIRVVELATFVAAPSGGALLADLGAEVIKVEPPEGDFYRSSLPRYGGYQSDFPEAPPFHMDNRGKRSLALDLTRVEARDALLRVVDRADVFLTNMLPERRRRFGLDPESLLARRPGLIYASLTGYGSGGPEADRPAFDYAAYWARTGMMDLMREPASVPAYQRPGLGDHAAGLSLVAGILAALRTRDRTGQGQVVDVSLLQIGLYVQGNDLAQALVARQTPPRHDRTRPRNPLWNQYRAKDGRWLFLVMLQSERYWPELCKAIGRPDLLDDARFAGPVERYRNSQALVGVLDQVFAARTLAEWEPLLDAHALIWSPVREMSEVFDDPQVRAMGYFRTVESPTAGRFETMGPPFALSHTPLAANLPAPALGADSRAVLADAGLDDEQIRKILGETQARSARSEAQPSEGAGARPPARRPAQD